MVVVSDDFKVAFAIYKAGVNHEKIWYSKLVNTVKLDKNIVSSSIDTLSDYGIIEGEYGNIDNIHSAYLFHISDAHKARIENLYNSMIADAKQ